MENMTHGVDSRVQIIRDWYGSCAPSLAPPLGAHEVVPHRHPRTLDVDNSVLGPGPIRPHAV